MISDGYLDMNLNKDPLYVMNCFSLVAFKILFGRCPGMGPLEFLELLRLAGYIWEVSGITSSSILFPLSSVPGTLVMFWMLDVDPELPVFSFFFLSVPQITQS
jgi:hypothetical protein